MSPHDNETSSDDAGSSISNAIVPLDRPFLIKENAEALARIDVDGGPSTQDEKFAYYRATKGDIDQATSRIQATHTWRAEMRIDEILVDPEWIQRERECRRNLLMYDYLGLDRHGRPVMVERVGQWNVSDVLDAATDDPQAFLKLHCMACETMLRMDRPPATVDNRGQVVIMDCMGLSVRHLDPQLAMAFGKLARNDAAHYPDTLAHIFVVNAPYLFSALATAIAPFMDPDTYSKVHVSSGVPEELVDCVGSDCLPVELGGKRKKIFPYDEEVAISDHPVS